MILVFVSWNDLNMTVVEPLTISGAHLETNGESVGSEGFSKKRLDAIDQEPACLLFALGEMKITGDVPLRNHESVARNDGLVGRN